MTSLGALYEKVGQLGEAIRILERLRAAPAPEKQLLQLYEDLGRCYYKIGERNLALAYLKCALDEAITQQNDYKTLTLSYSVGVSYYELNRFKEAIQYFEECVNIAKAQKNVIAQVNALTSLGNAYMGLGETDENISKSLYYQKMAMKLLKASSTR